MLSGCCSSQGQTRARFWSPLTEAYLGNAGFRWLSGQEFTLAGIHLRALRVNYVGESHGIADFGSIALNFLRMEKAYRGMGSELTNEINLIEADCTRFYAPAKGGFRGRDATEVVRDKGITTRLGYGEVAATGSDIYGGAPVMQGARVVGVCTPDGYGHATGKSLAFAYLDPAATEGLEVVILGERRALTLHDAPLWDADNSRQKA